MSKLWPPVLILLYCEFIYCLSDIEYERMPALYGLDDYDSCFNDEDGVYCILRADLMGDSNNELMRLITKYSKASLKHYDHSYIQRGVCVKKTCTDYVKDHKLNESVDVAYILGECLNDTIFKNYGLQSKVQLYYCDRKDAKNEINLLDWCIAGLFLAILLANLIGSVYDYNHNINQNAKDQGNKYILSFSVMRNWKWLLKSEFADSKLKSLNGFYGARTVTNILMVLVHTMFLIGGSFTDRPHDFEKSYNTHFMLFNGLMLMQLFFHLSGFLLTYNFLVRTENSSGISWTKIPVILFLRWWRLTPTLAVVIAFSITWLRHLGSGPLWNLYITDAIVPDCQKYWWAHLLYFNNYIYENKNCAIQSWYIAADCQLFLIGLVVLVATTSRGRGLVLGLLMLISIVLPAYHVWLHDLDGATIITPELWRVLNNDTYHRLHIYGHNNMSSYVVGMLTALLVYKWQNSGAKRLEGKVPKTLLWLVLPGMAAVVYSSSFFYTDGEKTLLVLRMLYQSLHRLVISVIFAYGIVGLTMKSNVIIRHLFEWRGWVVPGRLTYSVYLLHMNVVVITDAARQSIIPTSYWYLLIYFAGITTISYIISVPFFLMVEAPLNALMKNLTSKAIDPIKRNESSVE